VVLSHDTSSCSCSVVASPHSDAVPALFCVCVCVCVCVDACDARGCLSSIRLGCRLSPCCCSACASFVAFTRCLQLLCCC
jgi:hypothetical protein